MSLPLRCGTFRLLVLHPPPLLLSFKHNAHPIELLRHFFSRFFNMQDFLSFSSSVPIRLLLSRSCLDLPRVGGHILTHRRLDHSCVHSTALLCCVVDKHTHTHTHTRLDHSPSCVQTLVCRAMSTRTHTHTHGQLHRHTQTTPLCCALSHTHRRLDRPPVCCAKHSITHAALRVLDTQDLHFLRRGRERALLGQPPLQDDLLRELSAVCMCVCVRVCVVYVWCGVYVRICCFGVLFFCVGAVCFRVFCMCMLACVCRAYVESRVPQLA
jgi:hypothetical protein